MNTVRIPFSWIVDACFRGLFSLAVTGVLVYLLIENLPESQAEKVALADAVYLDDQEFKKALADYDREELTQLLEHDVAGLETSDPLRRQGLANQIRAAHKLSRSPMQSRKVLGISKELELRILLALSDMENSRFDDENNKRLAELSQLYEGINFQDEDEQTAALKEKAGIGLVLANFIACVEDPSDESAAIKEGLASEKLQQLGQRFVISKESQDILQSLLGQSRLRLEKLNKPADCCDNLEDLLAEVNRANREKAIDEFTKIDCSLSSASVLDYLEEEELIRKDRFLRDFERKLRRLIQCGDLSEGEFSVMLEKLNGLFRGGWTHATRRMLTEVVDLMNRSGNFPELQQRATRLELLLAKIGKRVNDSDFKTSANQSVKLGGNDVIATFVVYLSVTEEERTQESNAKIIQMARVYNTLISTKKLAFYGIVVHQDQESEAIGVVEQFSELLKPIEFWHLNTKSQSGKELLAAVPANQLPHVLILDKLDRVAAIDPRPTQTIEIVGKLKLMDR